MKRKKSFLDRFIERAEDVDANSRQSYILRLARERGFFETVFDSIEEGILIVDRRLHIRYHNLAAKNLLGLPEDLSSIRLSQLLHSVNWRRILSEDADEWLRVSHQEVEILYPAERFIRFCLVPMEEDVSMAAVILRDVTRDRDRTINEINHETSQAVSMLAASVAHEIGNPLNSLYLNLQLLERASGDNAPGDLTQEEAHDMVVSCKNEVERLDNIITQFLSAIRPGEASFAQISLDKLLLEVLSFMEQEFKSRSIQVKCDWPEQLPTIAGDAGQLKQAFYNILRNSIQATPANGLISIKISFDSDVMLLEFADSGRGIDPKEINRIFVPFQSFKANGNGLGMMIVERIARQHGAELAVDSQPGAGTIVSMRFRRRPRPLRVLAE